ncbi:MAG TPA: GNAT family N-acetyltransferase, partial [Thermoleophilia bacterium]|nr:GNAT family N-acetyltransferase [Thermoleophilia bacterium]
MKPGHFVFDDLGADVRARVDPATYAAELDALYSSLFATVDWFETHEDPPWMGACLLEHPRHVLLFTGKGDGIEILNKAFALAPADVERACRALFRAFPHVRHVRIEVMFPPADLRGWRLELFASNHMIVQLPSSEDDYFASLGKSTRKDLRQYRNRLARDFPDLSTEVFPSPGSDRVPGLFSLLLEWKTARFHERGDTTYWEEYPGMVDSFLALLERRGEVHLTTISGEPAALVFAFPVGDGTCAQEWAFDPAYHRYRLGMVSQYWLTSDAISRGYATVNMLWGTEDHKSHLGATPVRASTLLVFRDAQGFLTTPQTWQVAWRGARRRTTALYWRARHQAGARLRSMGHARRREDNGMTSVVGEPSAAPMRVADYPALGAVVYLGGVPPDVAQRVAPLYGSFRC